MPIKSSNLVTIFSAIIIIIAILFLYFNFTFLRDTVTLRVYKDNTFSTLVISTKTISDTEIENKFAIINRYFKKLKIGHKLEYTKNHTFNNAQNSYGIAEAFRLCQNDLLKDSLELAKYDLVILIDDTRKLVPGNVHGQYYFSRNTQKHFIRGRKMLLDDPLLFAHEFMHMTDLQHKNKSYQQDTVFNILSECFHIANYTFEKNQVLGLHKQKEVDSKSIFDPVNNNNIRNETHFSCDLYINLNPTEREITVSSFLRDIGCGECKIPILKGVVKKGIASQCRSKFTDFVENDPIYKYELEPKGVLTNPAKLDSIFIKEYCEFLKGSTLINESDFVERKKAVLFSIIKTNIMFKIVKSAMNKNLICEIPDDIWTIPNSISHFLSFAEKNNLLFDKTLNIKLLDSAGKRINTQAVTFTNQTIISDGPKVRSSRLDTLLFNLVENSYSIEETNKKTTINVPGYVSFSGELTNGQSIVLKSLGESSLFTFTGRVLDSVSEQPIIEAMVKIQGSNVIETTDINGRFNLSSPNENITIDISKEDYVSVSKIIEDSLDIILQEIPKEEDTLYTYKGRVVDASGDISMVNTILSLQDPDTTITTNADGFFEFNSTKQIVSNTINIEGYEPVAFVFNQNSENIIELTPEIIERSIVISAFPESNDPNVRPLTNLKFENQLNNIFTEVPYTNDQYTLSKVKTGDTITVSREDLNPVEITITGETNYTIIMTKRD